MPIVPTEVHYSWFYYEREDQVEDLLESLNIKGQRERKLQENLKKIKERLKLKKGKRVSSKLPDEPTVTDKPVDQSATEGNNNKTNNLEDPNNITMSEMANEGGGATVTANGNDGESLARDEGPGLPVNTESRQVEMTEESKTVIEEPSRDQANKSVDNRMEETV